ncbi:uncharacterized protein LOC126905969 [Daktulosphaira vitifoliae]|uniref:uncharacterized protein LOC126905969 n=1 Tax=Daktulosphaira vitifoliae TaxID=58002 RepID=UPI0021AAAA90|nr:uncharacterized protein LOC126905969 [Daktulosphaira vitifoliae]
MAQMSTDEYRRRRRTGADEQMPFPSVCRLVEKYTMLIERHRQKQNGLLVTGSNRQPLSPMCKPRRAAQTIDGCSSDYSSMPKSTAPSSPAFSDDCTMWNQLMDDEPLDDAEHYQQRKQQGQQDQEVLRAKEQQLCNGNDDGRRRLSCESLNGPGSDEEKNKMAYMEEKAKARAMNKAVVKSLLEVSKTKTKRKRRKSWTGPLGCQGGASNGPCRKGHSLDQGYELHHQEFKHAALFRSYSSNAGETDVPGARQFRTPSVVVSDHSEDPVSFSSMFTLDDLDEYEPKSDCGFNDSSSDCSAASTWSAAGSVISVLDADYSLHTPERKISGCSTCSVDEDAAYRLSKLRPKTSGWRKLRNIVQWTPFIQTYKKQRYPWVQLAGHQGNFKAGPEPGTILKKLCPKEQLCFQVLMKDMLRPFVPEYKGHLTTEDGDLYLQLEDLLGDFTTPCVMDCKIGVRTYLEEELAKAKEKPKLRKDMYEKMIQIDPNAPSEEEHRLKGVTKPRYMVWRETISSTATLGFRIEGIRKSDGKSSKDFKTTKSKEQVIEAFRDFINGFPHVIPKYINRLIAIRDALEESKFFMTHEVIGSSLLFVHDNKNANVWLIDFAKTLILPSEIKISHMSEWVVGNHEDGYLIGVNNLIEIFEELNRVVNQGGFPETLIEVTAPSEIT